LNKLLSKINGNFRFKIGVQGKKNKCHRQRSWRDRKMVWVWQVVLAIDEAQDLRYLKGFDKILAHIYDYVKGIKLVLAESEVGLLDKIFGIGNPKAPLFGRAFTEIYLKNSQRKSRYNFSKPDLNKLELKLTIKK